MDGPPEKSSPSMKSAFFMDGSFRCLLLSMKLPLFVDETLKSCSPSMKTVLSVDGLPECLFLSMKLPDRVDGDGGAGGPFE